MRQFRTVTIGFAMLLLVGQWTSAQAGTSDKDATPAESQATGEINAASATGGLRYSIMVSDFECKAQWYQPGYNITTAWEELLTGALANDGRFVVIAGKSGRVDARQEQEFGDSDWSQQGNKTAAKGHMTPAQLLVEGTLTNVTTNASGGKAGGVLGKIPIKVGKDKTTVDMTITVYDATTAQVLGSKNVTGNASTKAIDVSRLPLNANVSLYAKDNVIKALNDAITQAVEFIAGQLGDIRWTGNVVSAKPNRVIVNRGNREGVVTGQVFAAGDGEALYDPDSGELLDFEVTQRATLEVTEVREKISYCRIVGSSTAKVDSTMMIWIPETATTLGQN